MHFFLTMFLPPHPHFSFCSVSTFIFPLQVAGLSTQGAKAYGGWESPTYVEGLINGHFTGHLLSALAFTISTSSNPNDQTTARLLNTSQYLVTELSKCQDAIAKATPDLSGFVSAYTISQIERLEAHNSTQVRLYISLYTYWSIFIYSCFSFFLK